MGTYLWAPDEIEQMERTGNARAEMVYGGVDERPAQGAPYEAIEQYARDKYVNRKWATHTIQEPEFDLLNCADSTTALQGKSAEPLAHASVGCVGEEEEDFDWGEFDVWHDQINTDNQ